MKKILFPLLILTMTLCSCSSALDNSVDLSGVQIDSSEESQPLGEDGNDIPVLNDEYYRGFSMNNVLHSDSLGDIHYNVYVPDSYDGSKAYALYFTLPGYQGLYRFGVGANLETEAFAFEAMNYIEDMIIVAPQLNDWGETSAR